jgi:hypothetical protein
MERDLMKILVLVTLSMSRSTVPFRRGQYNPNFYFSLPAQKHNRDFESPTIIPL